MLFTTKIVVNCGYINTTLEGGSLNASLREQLQKLRSQPWVQSPLQPRVQQVLQRTGLAAVYFERGSGEATDQLARLEALHRSWLAPLIGLHEFHHFYFTSGITEAINQWRLTDCRPWQILEGDYQWPLFLSDQGIKVSLDQLRSDRVLYLTNPSARSGNFLSKIEVACIQEVGCPVILDCAYIGAVACRDLPIWDQVEQIMFGMSKGFGVVGQRMGVVYSRRPHPTLKYMKKVECWNYAGVAAMIDLITEFSVDQMHAENTTVQLSLCERLGVDPSDVFYLARSEDLFFSQLMRTPGQARICLTPLWNL